MKAAKQDPFCYKPT